MQIRYLQKLPHGARAFRIRAKKSWKRIAVELGLATYDGARHVAGFQIWQEWRLCGDEADDPLFQFHSALSALSRVKEFTGCSDLEDRAARLSLLPRRTRKQIIKELRERGYRERHKPKKDVPTKLTKQQRIEAVRRRRLGESCVAIAASLGVSASYVWQLCYFARAEDAGEERAT